MAISTFDELKAAVAGWLYEAAPTDAVENFISLAESRLNVRLRVRQALKRVQASLDGEYEDLPTGYLEMKTLHLTTNPITPVSYVPPQTFGGMPEAGVAGKPAYFTILGDKIRFAPVPSSGAYTAEMWFYQKLPALSDSNSTNWLLSSYPDIYLYAALLESAPYLREDARLLMWKAALDDALERLDKADRAAAFSAGPLVVRSSVRF